MKPDLRLELRVADSKIFEFTVAVTSQIIHKISDRLSQCLECQSDKGLKLHCLR